MKRAFSLALVCGCLTAALAIFVPAAGAHRRHGTDIGKATACGLDREYLKESMEGDLFEIRGGKIAQAISHNPAVLRLAGRLVDDHTISFEDAAKLARRFGVEVPKDPSPSEQWELLIVSKLRGKSFDQWYSSLEVFDHIQDIQLATAEATEGCSKAFRENARNELPMLHLHLRLAREALKASS
jgi:predicted outer membrane protein